MPSINLASIDLKRRRFVRALAGFCVFFWGSALGSKRTDTLAPLSAPQGPLFSEIMSKLTGEAPLLSGHGLSMEIPAVAENGALVPVTMTASKDSDALYLLAEGNPGPLLAEFHVSGSALPKVSLRVKLNQSGPVTALSHAKTGWSKQVQIVRVAVGGCG